VLVALLVGLGLYRARSRKKAGGETSFLESRLQPDSFFGASGGQRIDTREAPASSGGLVVDELLAQPARRHRRRRPGRRGRRLPGLRPRPAGRGDPQGGDARQPERMAIRTKLLEVYAKRRDIKGFELLATQVHAETKGEGEDWDKAQEMGQQIDPDNRCTSRAANPSRCRARAASRWSSRWARRRCRTRPPAAAGVHARPGLDSRPPTSIWTSTWGPESPTEVTRALPASADISLDPVLDFEPPSLLDAGSTQPAAMLATPPSADDDGIDFDLDSLSIDEAVPKTMPLPRADVGSQGLDFADFGLSAPEPKTVSMGRPPRRRPRCRRSTRTATRWRASSNWPRSSARSATSKARATCSRK
jgi:pilus assembly protein FimV